MPERRRRTGGADDGAARRGRRSRGRLASTRAGRGRAVGPVPRAAPRGARHRRGRVRPALARPLRAGPGRRLDEAQRRASRSCTWSTPCWPPRRTRRHAAAPVPACGSPARTCARPCSRAREGNLVLFVVDASGSMGSRARMGAVKGAVLSLLLDAYQRRDKVGLVTFRGATAELALPPTWSVEAAAARLTDLPTGGRTPLAAGLLEAHAVLRVERIRDPQRRPLLVVVTDGRATGARGGSSLAEAQAAAGLLAATGTAAVVVDCESGPVRLGLAGGARDGAGRADPAAGGAGRRRAGRHGPQRTTRRPDVPQGQIAVVPEGRADHAAAAQPAAARGAHRRDEGQVHRRLRDGDARLEPGLVDRGLPVRQERQVEGRRGERAERAGPAARADRRGRPGRLAQDGLRLELVAPRGHRDRPRRRRRRGLGADQARPGRGGAPLLRARRVHLPDEVGLGGRRRRRRDADATGRAPSTWSSPGGTRTRRWSRPPTWWWR